TRTVNKKKKLLIIGEQKDSEFFEKIANSVFNCYYHYEIYYEVSNDCHDENNNVLDNIDINEFIKEVDLIIPVISNSFLSGSSLSLINHIQHEKSILPIVVEEISEDIFNEQVGFYHLLYFNDQTFSEKLEHFINEDFDPYRPLVENPALNKLMSHPNIFLSYRKKDHTKALELLNIIHSQPKFEALSVWYDDFLVAGENYNDNIDTQLKSCDFMVMCITKNILEPDNYVLKVEYPKAIALGKKIIPIAMEEIDVVLLEKLCPRIGTVISVSDTSKICSAFSKVIDDLNIKLKSLTPEEMGQLGKFYLEGKGGFERNYSLGIEFLRKAATLGDSFSCHHLGLMLAGYEYEGLMRINYQEAVEFLFRSLNSSYTNFRNSISDKKPLNLIDNFGNMAGITARALYDICKNRINNIDLAVLSLDKYFNVALLLENEGIFSAKINVGFAYLQYGILHKELGDHEVAMHFFEKATPKLKFIAENNYNKVACEEYSLLLMERAELREVLKNQNYKEIIQDYKEATEQLVFCVEEFSTYQNILERVIGRWYMYVCTLENSVDSIEKMDVIKESYRYIYNGLKSSGDFQSEKFSLLKALNAVALACSFVDVPNKKLLEYAKREAEIAKEFSSNKQLFETLIEQISIRIMIWPINYGKIS
ncbi:toll/interleukin-1 receptor domain-containing protein, partial [Streptococcus salivarius]